MERDTPTHKLFFSGVCMGTSGVGGSSVRLTLNDGRQLREESLLLLDVLSLVEAKYLALTTGLDIACTLGISCLRVYSDCEIILKQISGEWKTRAERLQKLKARVLEMRSKFDDIVFELVPSTNLIDIRSLCMTAVFEGLTSKRTLKCNICLEEYDSQDFFCNKPCDHSHCTDCVKTHMKVSLNARKFPFVCPGEGCDAVIPTDDCERLLPEELLPQYVKLEVESCIPDKQKYYCPYPNCSALLILDEENMQLALGETSAVTEAECPECFRLLCAKCQVPWHASMTCEQFRALSEDERGSHDVKLYKLADEKKWKRCSECRTMIELESGCNHMTCRCGHQFCYVCGAPWKEDAPTCQCELWDERNILREVPIYRPFRRYKTQLCRYWPRGICGRGERCTYAHGAEELRLYREHGEL